jgi:hypothetical protein
MAERGKTLPLTRASAAAADLVAGIAAGLAAALVMNLFQSAMAGMVGQDQSSETVAMKAADAVSEEVAGAPVKPRLKSGADAFLHYATGAIAGGIYGVVSGMVPSLMAGRGLLYGALLWMVADEGLVPVLGLAPPSNQVKLADRGLGLSAHLVFGLALDFSRRQLNRLISAR